MPFPRTRTLRSLVITGAALIGATACTPTLTVTTAKIDPTPQVELVANPIQASDVDPNAPVLVAATQGVLTEISVTGPEGEVPGTLSDDRSEWIATSGPLDYAATYTVKAVGSDSRGRTDVLTHSFTTVQPEEFFTASATPAAGEVVGVGMPIVVKFNKKVDNKAEVEEALVVRTSTPVLGAWSWVNDREVEYRPQELWPGNTRVQLAMNLQGVQSKPGVFGTADTIQEFSYRSAMVSLVNAATYSMDVFKDGELLKTIPITTGKSGFETRSGTKVLLSKERSRIMDAATGGTDTTDPDYYRVTAEYAMRLNYTGEFVHAAPWSVGSQGRANVSHGCVGMSTTNAQWWWSQNNVGDVVIVENTSRTQGHDNNGITVWNDTWENWLSRSATGAKMTETFQSASLSGR